MKIGDRVRLNVKDPAMMPTGIVDGKGVAVMKEVHGTIESKGAENEWHVDWDDKRRTDQNEHYTYGNRKGTACLLIVE